MPFFEVRSYHFKPELFEAYKDWARNEAVPFISNKMDMVGFWVDLPNEPPVVIGEVPDPLGHANITWIIRFNDRAHCDQVWKDILGSDEWKDLFSRVPGGPAGYLRIESRFMDSL